MYALLLDKDELDAKDLRVFTDYILQAADA